MATIQGRAGTPARKPRASGWVGAYPVPIRPTASKVNSMVRRSPQEKKALSYAKDRRNVYGENDKSSRKNIRRNKRIPNKLRRRGRLGMDDPAAVDARIERIRSRTK
jgi:hypothetical protein